MGLSSFFNRFILIVLIYANFCKNSVLLSPDSMDQSPPASPSQGPITSESLEPPRITEHPSDVVVKKNEPTMLYCKADGWPKPTIEWFKDGEKVKPSKTRIFLNDDGLFFYRGVQGESKDSDTGTYWCVARNPVGKVFSRNATVSLGFLKDEFRLVPKSGTVVAGDSVTMECSPPRGSPEPTVTWKKDGEPMNLGSPRFQLTTSGSLKINDIRPTDRGIYICVASNTLGTRESPPASLVVLVKPYFIKLPSNVTISEWSSLELECKVDGDPVPAITWAKKDGELPIQRSTIKSDKSLRIVNLTLEDEGVYICRAENLVGSAIALATVTVTYPGSVGDSPSLTAHSIAKEPYFIVAAILLMFLLCSIIMIVFARQHLGWKKAVGAYITVQLSKADELEKSRDLNTCSSKNSWLLETTTGSRLGSSATSKALFNQIRSKGPYSTSDQDQSRGSRDDNGARSTPELIKPFCHSDSIAIQSYPSEEEVEGYYAEVEGVSPLVTFGKKESSVILTSTATTTTVTATSTPSTTLSNGGSGHIAPSIEPYATTNLINTYHRGSNELSRACDQSHHPGYYGLPFPVNGSGSGLPGTPPSLTRHPQHYYHHHQQHPSSHINYHSSSPSSRSTAGLGHRKVILKDTRSDRNRAVLVTEDLYAVPNCGPDGDDLRPSSCNYFGSTT